MKDLIYSIIERDQGKMKCSTFIKIMYYAYEILNYHRESN